jgi:hypothetical protein
MRDRSTPRHRQANQGAPINLICTPQSMSTKKPMATHSGGSARVLVNPPVSLNVMLE